MKRLARIVGSFAIVVSAYWVYARTAVPMIEPAAKRRTGSSSSEEDIQQAVAAVDNQRAVLKRWFSAADWELTSPKILETPQGMLLLKTYHPLPDEPHKVRIEPCTMIVLPKGRVASEEERSRRAIVLRAPLGIMEFDGPFDLRRGDIGKLTLVGAQLIGAVLIRSEQRSAGPEDDLRIVTRDVTMSNNRVTTPHPITFDYGPNHGEGSDMVIELPSEAEKSSRPRGSFAASIKTLHLARNVKMRMHAGSSELFPGGPRPKPAAADRPVVAGAPLRAVADAPTQPPAPLAAADRERPKAPVLITCKGPFHLDAVAQLATFKEQVDVVQLNFEGPSDQLTCERLAIEFETAPSEPAAAVAAQPAAPPREADAPASPRMSPSRITADGNPVIITSPTNGVRTRCRRLEYDVKTGTGDLIDKDEVMLRQELPGETREIHAPKVHFERDPNDPKGRPSVFLATGKGWLQTRPPNGAGVPKRGRDGGSGPVDVRWTTSLHFRPHQGFQVLSVNGKAHVATATGGSLDADTIDVWLVEAPAAAAVAGGAAPATELSPRMLRALGHVRIESEQVTGVVGDLQMWFEPKPPPAPVSAPVDPAAPPPPPAEPKPKVAKRQRFHVSGDVLEANVKLEGEQPQVTRLRLNGHVRCKETQTEKPGEKPMIILGDRLTLVQPLPEQAVISVTGLPAHVDARGMTLLGGSTRRPGTIHFHRGENRIWVKDPGTLTLPGNRDLEGRPTEKSQPLQVDWRGEMEFDGKAAEFSGDVEARQEHTWIRTPSLGVMFVKTVRFASADSSDSHGSGDPPQVDRIVCRRGVQLESRGFDKLTGRELESVDQLDARDLTLHHASGDFLAHGPGTVESVRVDNGQTNAFLPANAANGENAKLDDQEDDDEEDEGFNFLLVRFQRQMTGNLRRQLMKFHGRVRAVYGPVVDWEARLNPDDPEELEVGGFVLRSEELTINKQSLIAKDSRAFELTATGNAEIEGVPVQDEMFLARASRLTYDMRKGLLVLDGQGREAQLYWQKRLGAAPDRIAARKIDYYPATQKFSFEGFKSGNINKLPEGNKQKKKP
ncbi:MAG TPA: hypothetical protein VMV69_04725 [Pirellulales bacterium]|nr:hypothetical protein [Pirellulales bacterium]